MMKFTMDSKELKIMMDKVMTAVNKKCLRRALKDCTSRLMIREF